LARRRYRNGVGTRVRENHTYPADFPCGIEGVWSITIDRDGTLLASELLQSSGDARYDYAVQLTIRATDFAPIPEEVPGNSLQETLRFTPKRCTTNNP
jgi:TonB family protein